MIMWSTLIQPILKLVLRIDGGHEAYDMPYGISLRGDFAGVKMHGMRANAGISADHNLAQALDALNPDRGFLTAGSVFTEDLIDGYIDLKMEEASLWVMVSENRTPGDREIVYPGSTNT